MNERINELKRTATIWCDDNIPDGGYGGAWEDKFAELIVRECTQTLIDNIPTLPTFETSVEDWDKGYIRAMFDCIHHIEEHFGVEE